MIRQYLDITWLQPKTEFITQRVLDADFLFNIGIMITIFILLILYMFFIRPRRQQRRVTGTGFLKKAFDKDQKRLKEELERELNKEEIDKIKKDILKDNPITHENKEEIKELMEDDKDGSGN